ncbi:hypothetical protein BHM03_00016076 [Ensete ventricosum]|nr:hypothetical protein BHM03_00016076 [Ensete ventricosum]
MMSCLQWATSLHAGKSVGKGCGNGGHGGMLPASPIPKPVVPKATRAEVESNSSPNHEFLYTLVGASLSGYPIDPNTCTPPKLASASNEADKVNPATGLDKNKVVSTGTTVIIIMVSH